MDFKKHAVNVERRLKILKDVQEGEVDPSVEEMIATDLIDKEIGAENQLTGAPGSGRGERLREKMNREREDEEGHEGWDLSANLKKRIEKRADRLGFPTDEELAEMGFHEVEFEDDDAGEVANLDEGDNMFGDMPELKQKKQIEKKRIDREITDEEGHEDWGLQARIKNRLNKLSNLDK